MPQLKNKFSNVNKKQALVILLMVVLGLAAGAWILQGGKSSKPEDRHAHDKEHHEEDATPAKGPHGGKLFTGGDYALEVTIFETNVEPEFRIYTYQKGQPLTPSSSKVAVTLERLGRKPQVFSFLPQQDYLKGNATVDEPHSFAIKIVAQYQGKAYEYQYEQVESRVTLSDEQMKTSGVDVASAGPARIKSILQLTGEIGFNQDKTLQVVPRLMGLVESVPVSVGDKVRRGQVLAVISSQALADQRSELAATRKRLGMARITYEREKKLWEEKISAQQDYLQAQQALQEAEIAEQLGREKLSSMGALTASSGRLTRYEILAPIDGLVTAKKISVGEVLKDDANIFTVADLSTVWVELNIPAKDLIAVKSGQPVTVKASAFDASATGSVSYVGALIGNQTRTAIARVVLPNAKGLWHPGLPVSVDLVSAQIEVPIAIAADAVQTLRDSPVVFGRYGSSFEARPVELGRTDGKMVEVIKGLELGEKYASRNSYLIKADIGKSSASHDH